MNVSYDPQNEVIVTVGGSEAIDISLRALINPGDEVFKSSNPAFVCYAPIVELSGGIPVSINTRIEDNFKLTPELLKEKNNKKDKASDTSVSK